MSNPINATTDAEYTIANPGTGLAVPEKANAALVPSFDKSALLKGQREDTAPPDTTFRSTPYVGFLGKKSEKNLDALAAAGIQVNEFYLHDVFPVRTHPTKIHLLGSVFRAYTLQDDDGNVLEVSLKYSKQREDDGFNEQLIAPVAVVLPGKDHSTFVAATLALRGAQAKALKKSMDLFDGAAGKPDQWASYSPAHEAASKSAFPGGRFRATIWSTPTKPVNGGKREYNLGDSAIVPTPAADVSVFDAWVDSSWPAIERVLQTAHNRAEQLKRKAQ